jgi:DNA replication protein DnaC
MKRNRLMTPFLFWAKLIGDVPSATAILDRFLQHAQVMTITGRSYRLKDHPRTAERKEPITESASAESKATAREKQ